MMEYLPIALALVAAGALAGILAGLLGVGGGIVIVPVLYTVFTSIGISPATAMSIATATSLPTIVPTSISSARAHQRRGNVDPVLVRTWAVPLPVGVVAGSLVAVSTRGTLLSIVFGTLAVLVALNMLLRAKAPPLRPALPGFAGQSVMASTVGFFSVLMGVGAGTLGVPMMTSCNVPPHRAVGTASLFGLFIALPASVILLTTGVTPPDAPPGTYGLVNLPGFAVVLPTTILLAPYGVKIGARLDPVRLKQVFACFLVLVGLRMLWQSLG